MRLTRPHATSAPVATSRNMSWNWLKAHTASAIWSTRPLKAYWQGQIERRGGRCKYTVEKYEGASVTRTPGQLVGGKKACRNWEEEGEKKSWLPHQRAVHLLGSRQTGWIRPKRQSPSLFFFSPPFCFFLFSLFTIRVVYHSLASHIWITLTHFSSLDWKQCLVFPKPLGHEMHAGCNPKPQSAPRERQTGEEEEMKRWSNSIHHLDDLNQAGDSFVLEYMCTRMHPHVANREFEARLGGPQAVRLSSSSLSKKQPLHLVRPSPSAPPSLERSVPAHTSRRHLPVLFR